MGKLALLLYLLPMYHFFDAYEVFNEHPIARAVHVLCWPVIEAVSWALFTFGLFVDPENRN
jgi:hypothetical protein